MDNVDDPNKANAQTHSTRSDWKGGRASRPGSREPWRNVISQQLYSYNPTGQVSPVDAELMCMGRVSG